MLDLLGAALDVKQCIHQLREGKQIYRFFWSRLLVVERRMLNRSRLLSDADIMSAQADHDADDDTMMM